MRKFDLQKFDFAEIRFTKIGFTEIRSYPQITETMSIGTHMNFPQCE